VSNKPILVLLVVSVVINLVAVFTFAFFWREQVRHRNAPPPRAALRAPGDRKAPDGPASPRQAGGQLDLLQKQFNLTSVQMDTIRVLHEVMGTTMRPVNDTLAAKQDEMLSLLKEPALDQARVDRLAQEIVALRATLETRSLGILLRLRNVLTPEQRSELGDLFIAFRAPGGQSGPTHAGNLPGGPPPGVRPEVPPSAGSPRGKPGR